MRHTRLTLFGILALLSTVPARAAYPVVATATVAGSGGGLDAANAIARDSSGNLYVAGSLTLAGMGDLWVAKFSSGLVMLSSYTYDYAGFSDVAFGVALDTSGGVYAAGYVSTAPTYSGRDIWLAKFDSNLVLQASVTVNGAGDNWDEAKGLRVSSGSVYAVGHSSTTSGKGQWVARYNSALVLQSSSTYVQFDAYGIDILPAASGNVFVVGSRAINAATSVDAWIGKYDSSLVLVASRAVAGPAAQSDEYQRLIEDGTGGVFAVGYLYSATAADRYIDHFDSNLVRLSSSLVNGPGNSNEHYHDIVLTPSGNLLLAGDISDTAGAGSLNAYFAEYTTGLAFVSSTSYRSSGTGDDHANAIVLDASYNLYAAGWTTEATQDAWLGRFNAAPVSPPASPTGLAGTAQSTSTVLWSWTDNSSDETGFRLIISTTNVSGDLAANTTTWLQTGLGVNTSSGPIWVRVFNATGTADSSTLIRYSLTDPPNSISATFFGSSVALTWPTMTNTANTRWSVERGSDGVSYAAQLYFSSGAAAFTDTGLAAATTYYYRVRSANQDGVYSFHANSSTSVYTGGFPAAASAFAGTAQSTTSILWSWADNSSDELGFRLMAGATNVSGDLAANATMWLQTGLTVNTSSGPLLVQVFNATGTANSGAATRYSLAEVPTGLASSSVFQTSATVSWTAGNPAGTIFELQRSSVAGFSLVSASSLAAYTNMGLEAASTYYFRVRALNADSLATAFTATITVITPPAPIASAPSAPSGFAGAAQTTTSILWTWTDNSSDESGFRLMTGATNVSGDLAANATSWLQTGLAVNTSSGSLLVQVFNATGTANSGSATRYSLAAVPASLAPSGVGLGAATLSWASGGNPGGTVYQVERSTGAGFGLRQSSGSLSFVDATLSPASTYYYRVRALNEDLVASAYTSTVSAVTAPLSVYPSIASISPSSSTVVASVPVAVVGAGFDASAVLTLERHSVDSGVWVATGSFAQPRHSQTMIRLRDGRALLVGGLIEGQTGGRPEVDLYDLAAGTWTAAAPLNVGRFQHADVMLADGRVLVTGGQAPDASVVASAEIYDPASAVWTVVAPMSQVRKGHRMALLPDGRVLAAGGYTGAVSLLTAEIYDPLLNSWSAAASMSVVRAYPTLTMLGNGKVLVAGGRDPTVTTASAQVYDHLLNSWTATGAMSVSRSDHEAVSLPDGRVLVAGGLDAGGEASTADVYDPVTSSWTATGLMGAPRRSLALALANGSPLAIGGQNAATDFASTDMYDAATNAWRAGPSLTNTRTIAAAVALDDGRVLVAGGRRGLGGGTTLNTAERLGTASAVIAATGLSVPDAQHVNGAVSLTGAATGYWDVVVREPGGRVGRLNGGFQATPVIPLPAAPSGFAGSAQSTASILWSWTDNAANELGYRVLYGSVSVSGDLAANTTSWLQTGLSVNTSSWPLFAQAANSSGTANSGATSLYTHAAVPGTPTASGVYQTSATLNWSGNGNPAGTVFQLERSTGTGYGLQFAGAATSYFDQYLTPGATNVFRVRALNGDAVATAYSSSFAVVAVPPPATPGAAGTPVGAALGTSSVSWTWVLASGATNHFLFRPSDNSYLGSSSSGPFIQTALTPNTAYGLKVAGVNLGGTGPLSPSATVYTLAAAPSGGAVGTIASTSVVVSWGLNGNPASTVAQLERSSNAVAYAALASGAISSYADADLIGCTTYYYRVRHVNGDGFATLYSSFSGLTANTLPGPPAGLTASANAGGTVGLSWSHSPTEGVTGYRLYWDAGTGTVSYGAAIAVLGSTDTAFTTGVLASSASYTFALRAAHRCGLVETTGALAMSGAAAAPPPVRAAIKEPDSGRRISGNRITILGELLSGTPGDVQQVLFQYKLATSTAWLDVGEANLNHENPDFDFPYFVHVDVTVLAAGSYDLRAVAYDRDGVPDAAPPAVRVAVDPVTPDISETQTADGKIKKDQTVSNAVTSTVETAGAGASDPSVRVSLPPGVVTSATATISVIANPTITTAAPSGQTFVGSSVKIDLSNGQAALNGTAAITMTYPDTVRFPSLLQIFYLNEATGQWSRDFATAVDTASRTVTGLTPHFSTFALMLGTAFAADLNSVQVYPVPFKPNGTHPDEGRPFTTGNANSGIIFSNLAMGAEIKIYTLTGRLVSSIGNPSIAGTVRWDARNQDGRDVASGAYFAVITAGGHKAVVKKLVIIR